MHTLINILLIVLFFGFIITLEHYANTITDIKRQLKYLRKERKTGRIIHDDQA